MSARAETVEQVRPVLRCIHCDLNQYRTQNECCRRCGKRYEELEAPAPAKPPAIEKRKGLSVSEALDWGLAIRLVRLSKGWSQVEFADRLEVQTPMLSRWECGHESPTLQSLIRAASILEVPLARLSTIAENAALYRGTSHR